MIGQICEAPSSVAWPESQFPCKGVKALVKVFYKNMYKIPPVFLASFPSNWTPHAFVLETTCKPPQNYKEHHTVEQYTHHLLQFNTTKHLQTDRVTEIHIVFDDSDCLKAHGTMQKRCKKERSMSATLLLDQTMIWRLLSTGKSFWQSETTW